MTGRSPRVLKSSSIDVGHPHWNELISAREHLGESDIRDVFQRFVDEGALALNPPVKSPKRTPFIVITGNISNKKIRPFPTDNTHLVSLVEEVIANFPAIMRK